MKISQKSRKNYPLYFPSFQQLKSGFICLFIFSLTIVIIPSAFSQVNHNARNFVEQSKQYYQEKNYPLAIKNLQQAISIFAKEGERENQAISLTNLSRLQLALSQNKEALTSLETATNIWREEEKYPELAQNLTDLAQLQLALGKPSEAQKNFEETSQIYQVLNETVAWSNSLIYQALALKKIGFYPSACYKLIEGLTISQDESTVNQGQVLCQINNSFSEKNPEVLNNSFSEKNPEVLNNSFSQNNPEVLNNSFSQNNPEVLNNSFSQNNPEVLNNSFSEKNPEVLNNNFSQKNPEVIDNSFSQKNPEVIDNSLSKKEREVINNNFSRQKDIEKRISNFVTTISESWQSRKDSQYIEGLRNLGDILRALGKFEESRILLEKLNSADSLRENKVAILLSLANTYTAIGTYEYDLIADSKYDYKPWQYQPKNQIKSEFKKNENETVRDEYNCKNPENKIAKNCYQQALNLSKKALDKQFSTSEENQVKLNSLSLLKIKLNYLSLLIDIEDNLSEAEKIADEISQIDLDKLPITESLVYGKIKYAKNLAFLAQISNLQNKFDETIISLLEEAIENAQSLPNKQSESYAKGNLAGFYEFKGEINKAKQLTQEALYLTQPSENPELAYQWQWQLARLLTEEGKKDEAIDFYRQTKETLNQVRSSLLNISDNVNFSFQENIAPFYFQYLNLLLGDNSTQENLQEAISVIDSFQTAQLENFLRCNLSELSEQKNQLGNNQYIFQNIAEFEPTPTRIIYPLVLEDRFEILVENPLEKEIKKYSYVFSQNENISSKQFQDTINSLISILHSSPFPLRNFPKQKQERIKTIQQLRKTLYDCLIQPIENDHNLPEEGTLMFVLDSRLQNIPIAVLGKGEKYLIEKYSIAVNLRSQLPKPTNKEKPQQYNALLAGIANKADSYPEKLDSLGSQIKYELKKINQLVSSQILFDEEFTEDNLQKKINANNFNIVHLSTHGEFNSNPEKTLIYAWDDTINANELGELLKRKAETTIYPIDLLVLSACETADGQKRAPLGITGIALKSEAHSILASLWQANAKFTAEFMTQFYDQYLNENQSKAFALRKVQMSYITDLEGDDYKDPYYWSTFILVGNWL